MVSFAEMLVEHLTTELVQNIVQDRWEPRSWYKISTENKMLANSQGGFTDVSLKSYSMNLRQPHPLLHTTLLWFTRGFPGVFYR